MNPLYPHYEYLNKPEMEFLGLTDDSGAIQIAHELGHAYLNTVDPFNVYIVENEIRNAFNQPARPRYLVDSPDHPDQRGQKDGLVWDRPMSLPRSVGKEQWLNQYLAAQNVRNQFIDDWGKANCNQDTK